MKNIMFLFLAAISSLYAADEIVIPRDSSSAIIVDGKINKEEYQRTSMLGGMLHITKFRMVNRDVEVYFSSTPKELFLAIRTPVEVSDPDGGLVAMTTQNGGAVYHDDCVEFFIGSEKNKMVYQFLVNRLNVHLALRFNDRKSFRDWKPKIRSAGSIRNGFWEHEIAIPWEDLPGIDPTAFHANVARNFISAGFGYSSLTGQRDILDLQKMVKVTAKEGFCGVKVWGVDTSLTSGTFHLRCESEPGTNFTGDIYEKRIRILKNDPAKPQELPDNDLWKFVTFKTSHKKFGVTCWRKFFPFEPGRKIFGSPMSSSHRINKNTYVHLRCYPSFDKVSVTLDLPGRDKIYSGKVEVVSPDGKTFSASIHKKPDKTWNAMIHLPADRAFGKWNGHVLLQDGAKKLEYRNAFFFEEKKFPWLNNRLGYSDKILKPFTAIRMKDGNQLSTVLRTHTLGQDGLLLQAEAKGVEIFRDPLHFELVSQGKNYRASDGRLRIREAKPNRVVTHATAKFGKWDYSAETTWDYDGFAFVKVRFTPPADEAAERLTLSASLIPEEATLFHAVSDVPRGNPAGYIPTGQGKVWDSSTMLRMKNRFGQPFCPGEFLPYLWFGGDERGLCFLFDSPQGFDLQDGIPMFRLIREKDRVKAECDIVSRKGEKGKSLEFSFAFQVTPVKPRMPGWKKWVFHYGDRLPGMLHMNPISRAAAVGLFPDSFRKLPYRNDYSYAKLFVEIMKTRKIPQDAMMRALEELTKACEAEGKQNSAYYKVSYWKSPERFVKVSRMYYSEELTKEAMTLDRVIPYNCASIISLSDPAYQYHKAEWATRFPYREGMSDRIFMTKRAVDYLLWTYDKLLEAGVDGINFDETYVIPQSNPELSCVRDYKGRMIPEMGLIAQRELYKRLAYIMDARGKKERLISLHLTNSMTVPVFAFGTISIAWEYSVVGNFINQFPLDYIRAHSTGLHAGLVPVALVLPHVVERAKIPHMEYVRICNRFRRTAMALMNQHEISTMKQFWGDYTEQFKNRYVQWAYGTHEDNCVFLSYTKKENPFRVSGNFVVSCYKRDKSALFIVSNLGKEGKTTLTVDWKKLGIPDDAVLIDPVTGKRYSKDKTEIQLSECDFCYLYAGDPAFGKKLFPPEPDMKYIRK